MTHPTRNCLVTTQQVAVSLIGVAVSGNTVFVANGRAGLSILNVRDPSNPQLLGIYPAGSASANGVAISDNTVFVANGDAVQILDLRLAALTGTPSKEVKSGQRWAVGIAAQDWNGALILDTFQLTADNDLPRLVENTLTDQSLLPGSSLLLSFKCQQLFSVSDTSFLGFSLDQVNHQVLPAWLALEIKPTLLGTYNLHDAANGVAVSGNTVFVANGLQDYGF